MLMLCKWKSINADISGNLQKKLHIDFNQSRRHVSFVMDKNEAVRDVATFCLICRTVVYPIVVSETMQNLEI